MKFPITRRLAAVLCLLPVLAGAPNMVRHKIPGSDFPIAPAVSSPAGAPIHVISGEAADPNARAAFSDTKAQTAGVLKKIRDILQGMGMGMGDVVKMQVFLVDDPTKGGQDDVASFMDAYTRFFGGAQANLPAPAVVQGRWPEQAGLAG